MTLSTLPELTSAVHILVVDDEPEIAESLAVFLANKEGYRVSKASTGEVALSILESTADSLDDLIDLVLLDMRMPSMSGLEVLAWLRQHPKLKFTRVIVLTAASSNQEKVQALSAGADDYITKPYYPQELLARVKTILRSQQLEKQLQRQSQQLAALNRVSHAVTATLETKQVLAAAVDGVNAVLDVDLAAIFMLDAQNALRCQYLGNSETISAAEAYSPTPVGQGIIGTALSWRKALYLNDPGADSRYRPDLDNPPNLVVRSMMVTPLIVRGRPVGVLAAYNKKDGAFWQVDTDLFDSLAGSISRAIENAWLFQSVRLRQQELLESRNMLQAVIDGILHPIYTINEDWQLVAVNKSRADDLATVPDALVGQTCYHTFFDRDEPCEHCAVALTLAEKQARRWSVRWLGPDHLSQEWDVNAYPIPGTKAGSARAVVVWQDRTEERNLENSLMQAGKLTAIGQLAAGVAHEINNPLTVINANAQMLKMVMPGDDDNLEAVDLIARAGERATKVVRGLLDFARQAQYDFEVTRVNDSVLQALDLVSYQLHSANIEVVQKLAAGLPGVMASSEHLKSVWLNLLINARDAVQLIPDNRRIEIVTRLAPSGDHVHVLIRDNGRGMSPAEQAHIFEPFYTTKAPGKGTGLGLATCHRIIQQHGGQVDVVSNPGEGTTFIVRLPAHEVVPYQVAQNGYESVGK